LTEHPPRDAGAPAAALRRAVQVGDEQAAWGIAVEAPVEIAINGDPWTVLLATPADLEDLAIGLALTEGVLRDPLAVRRIEVSHFLQEVRVDLLVPADAVDQSARQARTLVSGTACGLCGIESLVQLQARRPSRADATVEVTDAAVRLAFDALPAWQPVNRDTHSVHAAAWCTLDGRIELVREDVGRHNALDKLIGGLARLHRLAEPGFIIMSSRCSYELVAKSTRATTQLLATISAPTSLALSWADALALPLACTMGRGPTLQIVRFPSLGEPVHAR
jgi:FdhD protein